MTQPSTLSDAPIRFRASAAKAVEVVLWLVHRRTEAQLDVSQVCKAAWHAEVEHLNRYGRPIIGDDYEADAYGPVGRVIRSLLRYDRTSIDPVVTMALALEPQAGELAVPLSLSQEGKVFAYREPRIATLSRSETECLASALDWLGDKDFSTLVAETREHAAWRNAHGFRMRWEDFLDTDCPDHQIRLRDIAETAHLAVL